MHLLLVFSVIRTLHSFLIFAYSVILCVASRSSILQVCLSQKKTKTKKGYQYV